ncbi:hypothetical protein DEU56DRAFT_945746 [Suillus clintonianus]|uniref:uncharacterized protein n=1 Tax=Suillus clintonianus TaxID=1904413 RepID=UPI001B8846BB|nr:uncharacterized protein DEU56DRAFT_945746 [Suillus clintonianus]KAG2137990.1 hypothetical protein DEU56DRAFT_945746 [Suillus clintonianus]
MHSLPVELLDTIAQYLSSSSLAALAQTCSTLRPVAQRVLYCTVSASVWSQNLCVVDTLAKKPHVARFVRSFYIVIDSLAPVFLAFYCQLTKAILNMSELTSLSLLVDSSVSWVLKEASSHIHFPHLLHFTCSFSWDENVARFLDRTPSLLELEVDSIPTMFTRDSLPPYLAPTSIPQLEQFIGSSRTAELIIPGRPLRSIHLNGGGLLEDDIPLLACSTVPVVILGAVTNAPPVPFLETLRRHVPHLIYLRVMSTKDIFKVPTAEFYEQVANILTSFTELSAFELSGMHWGSQPNQNDGAKRVWQSAPLQTRNRPDDNLLFGSEIFLAY